MRSNKLGWLIIGLLASISVLGQSNSTPTTQKGNKGKFYFFWGYNRGYYTRSDLHLWGEHYNFTLQKIVAKDRQTPFSVKEYFSPQNLTIPQCNYGLGYFISDHWSVSISADHMKYVMQTNQTLKINGYIHESNTQYDGDYEQSDLVVKDDFLLFEHTDGLNYVVAELTRSDNLLPKLFNYHGKKIALNLNEGFGLGALVPRTNATLLANERNDEFHLAGYGASFKLGIDITFFRHFYLAGNLKGGFIHMPDIRTTKSSKDRASQKFGFFQDNFLIGWRF